MTTPAPGSAERPSDVSAADGAAADGDELGEPRVNASADAPADAAANGPLEAPGEKVPSRPARTPDQTSDDTDVGWGEVPEPADAHDEWLLDQRPPHWD